MASLTHLHVCCGGFNTRAGSIIIGILCMVGGVFIILGSFLNMFQKENGLNKNHFEATMGGAEWQVIVQIILSIGDILISILMVWGAIKKIAKFVYPWIIVNLIQVALVTFLLVSMVIFFIVKGSLRGAFVVAVGECVYLAFHGYLILVVYSFHTTLKSGSEVSTFEMGNVYHHPKEQDMA